MNMYVMKEAIDTKRVTTHMVAAMSGIILPTCIFVMQIIRPYVGRNSCDGLPPMGVKGVGLPILARTSSCWRMMKQGDSVTKERTKVI